MNMDDNFEINNKYYLTPTEAIRVAAILDSALEKLELLSLLSTDLQPSELTSQVQKQEDDNPTTVANILEEQRLLGKRYEELLLKRGNDLKFSMEEKERRETELSEIHKKLKENTKILCRNLKETPNESNNWKKIKSERNEIQKVLRQCKQALMNGVFRQQQQSGPRTEWNKIRYDEFLKKVRKEQASKKFLEEIVAREKRTNDEVKRLREEVERERQDKEEEISTKTEKVTGLMNELRDLKSKKNDENAKYFANKNSEFECQRRLEKATIRELDEEWRRLKIELEIEKKVYEETKTFLEGKNDELNKQAKLWSDKFEKEQEEMQGKVLMWKAKREDQLKVKEKLEEAYKQELLEKHLREDQEKKHKIEEEIERKNRIHESATKIKLAWRCYKDREMFEQIKKQKKKKKKKKK